MRNFREYSNMSLWEQEWSLHGNKFGLSETEFFRSLLRLGVPAIKKINDLLLLIVKNEQVKIRGAWVGLKAQKLHDKLLHVVGEHALQCQWRDGMCYLRQILLMYFVHENQLIIGMGHRMEPWPGTSGVILVTPYIFIKRMLIRRKTMRTVVLARSVAVSGILLFSVGTF